MISHEERDRLLKALVGDRHLARFTGHALFHAQIQTLVDLLPIMVDGLAANSDAKYAEFDAEVLRLMSQPVLPMFIPDLDEL